MVAQRLLCATRPVHAFIKREIFLSFKKSAGILSSRFFIRQIRRKNMTTRFPPPLKLLPTDPTTGPSRPAAGNLRQCCSKNMPRAAGRTSARSAPAPRALASMKANKSAPTGNSSSTCGNGFVPASRINSRRHRSCATLDQLLRAAGGRFDHRIQSLEPYCGIYTTAWPSLPEPCVAAVASAMTSPLIRPVRARWCGHPVAPPAGPVPTCVFDRSCETVRSPVRRGANGRAALRPSGHRGIHPRPKDHGDLNISIGVTDLFMQAGEVRSGPSPLGLPRRRPTAEPSSDIRERQGSAYQRDDGALGLSQVKARP